MLALLNSVRVGGIAVRGLHIYLVKSGFSVSRKTTKPNEVKPLGLDLQMEHYRLLPLRFAFDLLTTLLNPVEPDSGPS
jgi:hypothetical protein